MKEELFKYKDKILLEKYEGLKSNHVRMHLPFKVDAYFSKEEIKILKKHKLVKR